MDWQNVKKVPTTSQPTVPLRPVRTLWRVERRGEGRSQVIQAPLYDHAVGRELRVFIEPEERNDLHSEVARVDFTSLEQKATALRDVLKAKRNFGIACTTRSRTSAHMCARSLPVTSAITACP